MKLLTSLAHCAVAALMLCALSCRDVTAPTHTSEMLADGPPKPGVLAVAGEDPTPLDIWWDALAGLCGHAYAGELTSTDAADADLVGRSMTMHVRRCQGRRLEIPFHIGENRSRTWVLTRSEEGVRLQHDHRHEDGSEDAVTLYGGRTTDVGKVMENGVGLQFPADDFSKRLFEANGLAASVANVWTMELLPGRRFSYILRRAGRHFQVDFDLARAVDSPPAPWGHE